MEPDSPGARDGGKSSPVRRGVRYVSALKVPVALFCVFGIGIAGYYFLYVKRQTRYVEGRNFRVLATIGEQLQGDVTSARTVIQSFLTDPEVLKNQGLFAGECADLQESVRKVVDTYLPLLRSIQICPGDGITPSLQFVEPSQTAWRVREAPAAAGLKPVAVRLDLADVVTPLMSGETIDDLFVSLALTTSTGRVIVQTGDAHLRVGDFGKLPLRVEGLAASQTFDAIAASPRVAEVDLAGSTYTLFVQPCCRTMAVDQSSAAPGWVLTALVPKGEMQRLGLAFPTAVVLSLSVVLLLAVLGWPFLKIALIGEHEPVRLYDVLLVAVCSLLGLSLLTVGTLDLYAYQKLLGALDGQLVKLADELTTQTKTEVESAYRQLEKLEARATNFSLDRRIAGLAGHKAISDAGTLVDEYPYFSSFALIGDDGWQHTKWTLASFLTPMVRIGDREYVTYWRVPRSERFFLDSIRSRTTGRSEAILSKPVKDTDSITGTSKSGISALTIPLRALLDPVLVPGFGFALIDDSGRVLFHSDSEHNLSESFFAESDNSRRLRALVGARHEELLNLRYWGEDHRAFLKPMAIEGAQWSLVTFYDKQLIRTVNMEAIISGIFYTLVYCGVFVCFCVGLLMFRPSYRAPWLWPDGANAGTYLQLVLSHLALTVAFTVAIFSFSPDRLLWTSWLLPLLTWRLTSFVLGRETGSPTRFAVAAASPLLLAAVLVYVAGTTRSAVWFDVAVIAGCAWAFVVAWGFRRRAMRLAPPLNLSYSLGASGFVLLTAILPAVGFFNVAQGIHTQNLIRYGQLTLVRAMSDRQERDTSADQQQITAGQEIVAPVKRQWQERHPGIGAYYGFFFETERTACPAAGGSTEGGVLVPAFLEELLPYYSESSVRLRELMHGGAADNSWNWSVNGDRLLLCVDPGNAAGSTALASRLLPLVGGGGAADWSLIALLVAGAILVVAAAVFVTRFIMRRIFVVEMIEPLWSGRTSRPAAAPPALLVLGQDPAADRFVQPARYHLVDLQCAGAGNDARRLWLDEQIAQICRLPDAFNILILRFDHDLADTAFNEHKLTFVEQLVTKHGRTVAIMSAADPGALFGSASAADGASPTASSAAQRWTALQSAAGMANRKRMSAIERIEDQPHMGWRPAGVSELLWRLNALRFSRDTSFLEYERRDPFIENQWNQVLPFAWQADARAPLDLEQLLIEVGDRSENYYQALWQNCSTEERLVLGQVAAERLVNEKSSRTVRSLMAKGLVERRPYFDVMNETFRRFVSTRTGDAEVTELAAQHGRWDNVRVPFVLLLGATAAVFFGTQRELFQQTIGIITAVAATLPTLIKAASLVGGRSNGSGGS